MQCSPLFCGTGYPNLGQSYYCYNNHSFPPHPVYPEIIGEGEVASVVFPDGSIHLYFVPLDKRSPTTYPNSSYNPYFNNSIGAYYVRNISNPIPSAVFNQQCQQMYGGRIPRPSYISDCNVNIPSPGFQLKFHNDCWTSTTDLHYFVPRLRRCEWFPLHELKGCASIQVDVPVKEKTYRNQEVTCTRPCIPSISDDESWSGNETVECFCDKVESRRSRSCVTNKQHGSNKRITLRRNKQKLKSKKSNSVESECNEPNTTDKSITTYAEQASSCAAENERDTQTGRSLTAATSARDTNSVNRREGKTELWLPKLSQGEEAISIARSSEKIIGLYEVTCSSDTCCCSTDTEVRDA